MIQILNKEYSGYVAETPDGTLSVIIHTSDRFDDVVHALLNDEVKEVTDINNGVETVYNVTCPVSARVVATWIYNLVYSTKPTYEQQMEAKIQEQSDAIDDLLVMILEG